MLYSISMDFQGALDFILDKMRDELSAALYYHGVHHTLDVLEVTAELCLLESVSAFDTILLKTAAAYHDSGFLLSRNEHERLSCEIVRETLPSFGYGQDAIEQICGMIMATKIPQNPQTPLEEILCDADLDYLGRPDFYPIGNTLFLELQEWQILKTEEAWNRLQLQFLQSHQFFTRTNRARREQTKQKHLKEIKAIIDMY